MTIRNATLALLMCASSASAQAAVANPVSDFIQRSYTAVATNMTAVIATMPEAQFTFRPAGVIDTSVRTFGQIAIHLIATNAFVCTMGDGKPAATKMSVALLDTLAIDKARLVALNEETNTHCRAYFATLTDGMLAQPLTSGSGTRALQSTRGAAAMFAIAHSNEHYGNLVTYLRANGLVPPRTPVQASFLSGLPAKP